MTQAVTLAQLGAADTTLPFRNRIINGGMVIDQRNAGASITNPGNNVYVVDRWQVNTGFTGSVGQNLGGVTPPAGYSNYLGMSVGSAGQSASNYSFRQWIEGFNSADLLWGTANAKPITISFWVRSSLTGQFGISLQNEAGNRSYPFGYTISAANTWQQVTVTVPGDTTGTWTGATNQYGLQLILSHGAATARQGTSGAWASADYRSVTGQVDLITTNGATFYATGVQLEVGTTPTPFERRPHGFELSLCQRYCYVQRGAGGERLGFGYCGTTTLYNLVVPLPVTMRATPTLVACSSGQVNDNQAAYDSGAITIGDSITNTCVNLKVAATGMTVGRGAQFYFSSAGSSMILSAEL
jgi:hypothetical protein